MKSITLLIPAYNEHEVLPELFRRLDTLVKDNAKYRFEFLFVNDGSRDETMGMIRDRSETDSRISYIDLSRNFGKEIAITAGIDHIKSDAMVILDADLQDPPELIPDMIALWEKGYDDIYARRRSRAGESLLKKVTSKLYYATLQKSTHIPIQRDSGDFRLLDRRCIDALKQMRESERHNKALFSWIGYKKKEILYDRDSRVAGTTKWSYPKLINLALNGITSFTTAPLRVASITGAAISFLSFCYILYLVFRPLFGVSTGAGYSSIMAVVLFLGGAQMLFLGIIGEYIGRIFNETKNRPLYLVEEYHDGLAKKTS